MPPLLGGLLLGGFLAFNALASPARVGKTAERALRRQFPGAVVHVEVRGRHGQAVLRGRFRSVRLDLSNARFASFPLDTTAGQSNTAPSLSNGARRAQIGSIGHLELHLRDSSLGDLAVRSADVSLDDVRYDFGLLKKGSQLRLLSFSNGKIALALDAPALLPIFTRRAPEIVNPRVELRSGEVILGGRRLFLGTSTSVVVRGPLVARGQELLLEPARVEVEGSPLPAELSAPVLRGVNPLYAFETDKWPFTLGIRTARADSGTLRLEGTLTAR